MYSTLKFYKTLVSPIDQICYCPNLALTQSRGVHQVRDRSGKKYWSGIRETSGEVGGNIFSAVKTTIKKSAVKTCEKKSQGEVRGKVREIVFWKLVDTLNLVTI